MTPSQLKAEIEASGHEPYYFSRATMRFFGDTMRNYGVCKTVVSTPTRQNVPVYELYRKQPVKHGLQSSAYFDRETFEQVHAG